MDPKRFDDLTRAMANGISRRQALKLFVATVVGGFLEQFGVGVGLAQSCVPAGGTCSADADCCVCSKYGSVNCLNGVCVCGGQSPGNVCNGVCTSTEFDPNNCGSCGNLCPAGTFCNNGQCGSGGGGGCLTCTNNADCTAHPGAGNICCPNPIVGGCCTDTQIDYTNCGGCGIVCPGCQVCCSGVCMDRCPICTSDSNCLSGQKCCNGFCDNVQSDSNNCGACGNKCPSGQSCVNGKCAGCTSNADCPSGQACCNGTCVNTQTDPNNCGACGNKCPSGQTCVNGKCSRAKLIIESSAPNTTFAITAKPAMPKIDARARIIGVTPDPTPTTQFTWTVQIRFNAQTCGGPQRAINVDIPPQTVVGGQFTPTFPAIRGGQLTLKVSAVVNGKTLTASTSGLVIAGTNPCRPDIRAALPNDTLARIACQESQMQQFVAPECQAGPCPNLTRDGGTGIMQITRWLEVEPICHGKTTSQPPTDDQFWDWTVNVAGGIQKLNEKVMIASQYPGAVMGRDEFKHMVKAWNHVKRPGLPPLPINLPPFDSEQLELDAIRGYNGWAGHDAFGCKLHEFRVAVDANGLLVVTVAPDGTTGTAQWERVPCSARPHCDTCGDPNYVENVRHRDPITCGFLNNTKPTCS